jgi:hypothetical protein
MFKTSSLRNKQCRPSQTSINLVDISKIRQFSPGFRAVQRRGVPALPLFFVGKIWESESAYGGFQEMI